MNFQMLKKSVKLSFSTACFLAFGMLIMVYYGAEFTVSNAAWAVFSVVAILVSIIVCAYKADTIEAWGPTKLMIVASMLSCVGYLMFAYRPYLLIAAIGLVCLLIGFSLFVMLLGKNLACTENVDRLPFLGTAMVMCGVFVAIALSLAEWAKPIYVACLPLVAMMHMYVVTRERDDNSYEFMMLEESRSTFKLKKHVLATTAITGLVWGVAFALLVLPDSTGPLEEYGETLSSGLIAIALAMGGAIFLGLLVAKRNLSEQLLLRSFALAAFIGIAPLPFFPEYSYPFFGMYLLFVFTFSNIMCYSAISELARFMQMSPYWVWGISLFWYLVGCILGFAAMDVALSTDSMALTALIIMAVIITGHSFIFEDNYPVEEADPIELSVALSQAEHEPTVWKKKLEKVATDYGLTARQVEVFKLLVRGRNAQYIAEQFVISNSTAKAHIHNIYQKLDIHSQQELIDLVENADITAA